MTRPGVAVLFALEREAAPFRRALRDRPVPGVSVVVSGIGPAARAAVERVLTTTEPPGRVVMAGFGGALRSGLAVGDVVVPAEVVNDAGGRWPTAGGKGRLLTSGAMIGDPTEKRRLCERFAADVVDMESAAVVTVCAARGVPFVAVRAVSDTVDTALSPELVDLFAGGSLSVWRVIRALVRRAALLGEFRRLARDTTIAARALSVALTGIIESPPVAAGGFS